MKLFKRRLTEPVQDGVEIDKYDPATEEKFVRDGDLEGWHNYMIDKPFESYTHIARQVARIEIEKARKEGMF